jgi:tRNA(His) 5'-end guanylyltransferase
MLKTKSRNALNGHCYWMRIKEGCTIDQATRTLHKLSVAEKNEMLWQRGINFNELPLWQRRGIGLYWETYGKPAKNRLTAEEVTAQRRRLKTDLELPMKDDYGHFIKRLVEAASLNKTPM